MRARRLVDLAQQPEQSRPEVIAEGLSLLMENAAEMSLVAASLRKGQADKGLGPGGVPARERTARLLDAVVIEECGAFFILTDIARTAIRDQARLVALAKRYTNHLAKGIYARLACAGLTLRSDAQAEADDLRADRYLDGPNDIDFIFRNDILAGREDPMYVDYAEIDGTHQWVAPGQSWVRKTHDAERALRLVAALYTLGVATPAGVRFLNDTWYESDQLWRADTTTAPDKTILTSVAGLTDQTIAQLESAGLTRYEYGDWSRREVVEHWSLPLTDVAMEVRRVTDDEIRDARERWLREQVGWTGYDY